MQPYFFPYIGYFQLINAVDVFVLYDNIEYTKKGWINRNRILVNGKSEYISLPIKKDSDFKKIHERILSDEFEKEKYKILRKIKETYKKSMYFDDVFLLAEKIILFEDVNLFNFIQNSIVECCAYMNISTNLIKSSDLKMDTNLKSTEKVIQICNLLDAQIYYNPIGGVDLYDKCTFENKGLNLNFLKSKNVIYNQFGKEFIPWLSIIDVLFHNSKEEITEMLNLYELI